MSEYFCWEWEGFLSLLLIFVPTHMNTHSAHEHIPVKKEQKQRSLCHNCKVVSGKTFGELSTRRGRNYPGQVPRQIPAFHSRRHAMTSISAVLHSQRHCFQQTPPYWLLMVGAGGKGAEEMLLKIKGSGDVKVGSRVIRHRRLRFQAAMSARQAD